MSVLVNIKKEDMENKVIGLILIVFLCELVGIIGSVFTLQSILGWYNTLQKPEAGV